MTSPDLPALIAEVRRLDAEATKGPWRIAPDPGGPACPDCGGGGDAMGAHLIAHGVSNNIGLAVVLDDDRENANAELLAAYRTAAPLLADECERLRDVIRRMLLSADVSWELSRGGHDWPDACEAARQALGPKP